MLTLAALPRTKTMDLLRKAYQWGRIAVAVRNLKCIPHNRRSHAEHALAAALGEARGLAMKIGQFMAGADDSMNPYHDLVVNVNPLPLQTIKPALTKLLKQPIEKVFRLVEESSAAASLGQVHRAELLDGTSVAIKIRYPGIVNAIKAELAITDYLPSGGPVKRWRINATDYKNVLRRQLLRETDYLLEMQTQERFKRNLKIPGLTIPDVFPQYCTDALLVQSWVTGSRLNDVCQWAKKDRLEIGRTLLMTLFQSLFLNGEIHGDPHPGNYLFRIDERGSPQTILLDYGCTLLVNKQSRLALLKLIDFYRADSDCPDCDPYQCFVAMGFDAEKLSHIQDELPKLCSILFRPFLADHPFKVDHWQISADLKTLLDERRWWFRAAGPAELFLLLRAFHGLAQQLEKLEVALPWWPLLKNVVGKQLLQRVRIMELPAVPASSTSNSFGFDNARKLRVRLEENGETKVSVDLPAEAVFDLESIIPGQILLMLLTNGDVNLTELGQRLRIQGLKPQTLFDFMAGTKQCRIWLE